MKASGARDGYVLVVFTDAPSAATALSLLILAASNVGMWLRIADVAAAPRDQLSEPELELTLGRLHGKLGQLEDAMAAQGAATAMTPRRMPALRASRTACRMS